jgi:hypothetical protein
MGLDARNLPKKARIPIQCVQRHAHRYNALKIRLSAATADSIHIAAVLKRKQALQSIEWDVWAPKQCAAAWDRATEEFLNELRRAVRRLSTTAPNQVKIDRIMSSKVRETANNRNATDTLYIRRLKLAKAEKPATEQEPIAKELQPAMQDSQPEPAVDKSPGPVITKQVWYKNLKKDPKVKIRTYPIEPAEIVRIRHRGRNPSSGRKSAVRSDVTMAAMNSKVKPSRANATPKRKDERSGTATIITQRQIPQRLRASYKVPSVIRRRQNRNENTRLRTQHHRGAQQQLRIAAATENKRSESRRGQMRRAVLARRVVAKQPSRRREARRTAAHDHSPTIRTYTVRESPDKLRFRDIVREQREQRRHKRQEAVDLLMREFDGAAKSLPAFPRLRQKDAGGETEVLKDVLGFVAKW